VLEERAVGSRLLTRLVTGEVAAVDIDRLAAFGVNIAGGARVAIIADMSPPAESQPTRIAELTDRHMIDSHVPHLIHVRDGRVLVLFGDGDEGFDMAATMAELEGAGLAARAGVGRRVQRADEIVTSAQDAGLNLAGLERVDAPAGAVACEADFGLAEWLVRGADASGLNERADLLLQKLKANPDLYETLQVYLRENLNIKAAAHALSLHPNSLRYRLARVEELIGRRLDQASTIVDVSLALLVDSAARSAGQR
jgi:PucR family transcriptional regulator, purine catabolism regulatory protein